MVEISFTSTQKFESTNLSSRGIYGISKPTDICTGRFELDLNRK
jgi:hypothetical protein